MPYTVSKAFNTGGGGVVKPPIEVGDPTPVTPKSSVEMFWDSLGKTGQISAIVSVGFLIYLMAKK